jgi:hypothetical protein
MLNSRSLSILHLKMISVARYLVADDLRTSLQGSVGVELLLPTPMRIPTTTFLTTIYLHIYPLSFLPAVAVQRTGMVGRSSYYLVLSCFRYLPTFGCHSMAYRGYWME